MAQFRNVGFSQPLYLPKSRNMCHLLHLRSPANLCYALRWAKIEAESEHVFPRAPFLGGSQLSSSQSFLGFTWFGSFSPQVKLAAGDRRTAQFCVVQFV